MATFSFIRMEQAAPMLCRRPGRGRAIFDPGPSGPRSDVKSRQTFGIDWLHNTFPGGVLGETCGLGKTSEIVSLDFQALAEMEGNPNHFYPSMIARKSVLDVT